MKKKIFFLNVMAVLLIALAFAVTTGGCGGSSNSSDSSSSTNPGTTVPEGESAVREETELGIGTESDTGMFNADGKPIFLDFFGVSQVHIDNSVSNSSVRASSASSVIAAAETNVNVPSMVWLSRLRRTSEGATIILVSLEAGIEYTFEFSINLTESLGGVLPRIKFYDPSNALLSLDVAEEMSDVEIAPYPPEHPSIICYTIKPTVSGSYLVSIANGDPHLSESVDTASVLFIYKERRNEKGETGYYTNFKFKDADGNKTDSISVNDIIELRKLVLEAYPNYFKEVYGQNQKDNNEGGKSSFEKKDSQDKDYLDYLEVLADYANFLELVQAKLGLVSLYDDPYEEPLSDEEFNALTSEDLYTIIDQDLNYTPPTSTTKAVKKVIASSITASALDDEPALISTTVEGIPYEERYHMGRGAMAFTFLDPPGNMEVDIRDKYDEVMRKKRDAKQPQASDTDADHPITTDYYAKFVNTASQQEALTKTTADVSLATSALGLTAGTGSSTNFKFGLTSTTLVIHYEETEIGYRKLTYKDLLSAWDDAGFLEMVESDYPNGDNFIKNFRNDFGDYYVSGYQYGACFDAYVSITTETSEQIKEVERKLSASLHFDDVNLSSDVSNKTKDTLKENKATVNVRIVTSGMGSKVPVAKIPKTAISGDVSAMDEVFTSLADFRNQLASSTKRSQYAPVRVQMTRWRQNLKLARILKKKGDTGKIPLTVGKKRKISAFNTKLRNLRAYRNVVADNQNINPSAVAGIDQKFNDVTGLVRSSGEKFYSDEYQASFDQTLKDVDELSKKFKALGDRYTFYTKLVIAQNEVTETYNRLKKAADAAGEGSETAYANVSKMPFGADEEAGYDHFEGSEYVTADLKKGKTTSKQYKRDKVTIGYRLEWKPNQTSDDSDYLPSAGNATLTAETTDGSKARFCYLSVKSLDKDSGTDRHREIPVGFPGIGKEKVGFYFMSGRGDNVDWNISGKAMSIRDEDYPFVGLK